MTQDANHWERLQSLFHLAEDTPEAELDAQLAANCSDPQLCRQARELILAARAAPEPAMPRPQRTSRIGPYTVRRHLGSGGIGSVYLADRIAGGSVQRCALKVLATHAAGAFFTERFAREQHILASLDHPNITRMMDAGLTEAGQPWLAMEYVDGMHLDVYCDEHHLGIPDRLTLFAAICDAVAYAHRNLIVHLDLKPSNILVVEGQPGTVKLLDFGTSKLIEPDNSRTTTVLATPAYASPEQLRNDPVTTACDIYALGAILFELLSGRRPNQDASVGIMIERSLKELPPESLVDAVAAAAATHRGLTEIRLRSLLTGDLATIVAKCLNPRPQDRYASVDALLVDLTRYREGRPILARPQTTTYRLGKFVRRNSKLVGAGCLAALALAASLGFAVWRQHQAVVEGQRAQRMQTFMSELFKLANTSYMGKPAATVPEFLQLGVAVLPTLLREPADQRAAQLSLAESMYENGDYRDAVPVFTQVIASARASGDLAAEAEAEAFDGKCEYQLGNPAQGKELASHALSLAHARGVTPAVRTNIQVFYALNQEGEGFRTDENIALLRAAYKESRDPGVSENEHALAAVSLGEALGPRGQGAEEETLVREALAIYDREPYAVCDRANIYQELALLANQRKDFFASLALMQQSYEGYQRCTGADSRTALETQAYLAAAMLKVGQQKAVISMLEASMPRWIALVGPDSDDLATPLLFLANAYVLDGQFSKAETTAANLVRVEQPRINPLSAQMGVCQLAWARALAGQHKDREAFEHAELADKAFVAENSKAPGTHNNAAEAHKLLLELRSRN